MAFRENAFPYFGEAFLKFVQPGFRFVVLFTVHAQFIHLQDVQQRGILSDTKPDYNKFPKVPL